MLCNSIKNFLYENRYAIILCISLFFFTTDAYAAGGTFQQAIDAMKAIFAGLRKIIYPAATIGVACVCIGGMFGNFNWKWLVAILLGVFIIATANSGNGVDAIALDGSQ